MNGLLFCHSNQLLVKNAFCSQTFKCDWLKFGNVLTLVAMVWQKHEKYGIKSIVNVEFQFNQE
jgi:hypothetical protein